MLLAYYIQHIFIFENNYAVQGCLKLIDCIVQSAEYWCLYGWYIIIAILLIIKVKLIIIKVHVSFFLLPSTLQIS